MTTNDTTLKLAFKVLKKKAEKQIEKMETEDYEFVLEDMAPEEWKNWQPTDDDIVNIMESIKFWENIRPKNINSEVSYQMAITAMEKQEILLSILTRIPKMRKFSDFMKKGLKDLRN